MWRNLFDLPPSSVSSWEDEGEERLRQDPELLPAYPSRREELPEYPSLVELLPSFFMAQLPESFLWELDPGSRRWEDMLPESFLELLPFASFLQELPPGIVSGRDMAKRAALMKISN